MTASALVPHGNSSRMLCPHLSMGGRIQARVNGCILARMCSSADAFELLGRVRARVFGLMSTGMDEYVCSQEKELGHVRRAHLSSGTYELTSTGVFELIRARARIARAPARARPSYHASRVSTSSNAYRLAQARDRASLIV